MAQLPAHSFLLALALFPSPVLASEGASLARQGGDLTVQAQGKTAFSLPAPRISQKHRRDFVVGNALFNENWVSSPSSVKTRQGLGPTFNAQSCSSCHFKDGRGAPPENTGDPLVGLLVRVSVPAKWAGAPSEPVPGYGDQIQHRALPGIPPEASVVLSRTLQKGLYPDGTQYELEVPSYAFSHLAYGPLPPNLLMSPRVAPAVFGMGLLEAIPEASLLAHVDPHDANGDGISGRANWPLNVATKQKRLGRFGWKANQPSVSQQNFSAFLGDMGITSPAFPLQNCEPEQSQCKKAVALAHPEIDAESLRQVDVYTQLLAVPAARNTSTPEFGRGLSAFREAGCASCHVESYVTVPQGTPGVLPELTGQTIRPYTDLLLHDMGEELADGRDDFEATGREWRTPPLWGVGLVPVVNGHSRYLHDGRARSLEEAILWHGGEAKASREAFKAYAKSKRDDLLFFLNSL